jgi:hypothetical protein
VFASVVPPREGMVVNQMAVRIRFYLKYGYESREFQIRFYILSIKITDILTYHVT